MTPLELYQENLLKEDFKEDKAQRITVEHTQRLYDELITFKENDGIFSRFFHKQETIHGLYLWGGTGRGKTYLIDSFYSCLPFKEKFRTHFHSFMRDIHSQIQQLPKTSNPLDIVASKLATKMRLLCLDEFHIHDIGDAMIMAGLLKAMYQHGITLVATSNISIDDLYKNGIQRELFMSTIEFLKQHNTELDMGHGTDYRFRILEKNGTYFINKDHSDNAFLQKQMDAVAPCRTKTNRQIKVNSRLIDYVAMADDVIWFDFDAICNTPRSDSDYISIAEQFHTVLLGNLPVIKEGHDNIAKRFIHLIDALYDHNVKCIISAADSPENLYQGRLLSMAFGRTISRLTEMGSLAYLSRAHQISPTHPSE
ncbi:MAG: cell division protein ZapE [Gammaproteobacteria bacterium]|nr:cell division protein ZapE [Gammaproteobacteria bacterium]